MSRRRKRRKNGRIKTCLFLIIILITIIAIIFIMNTKKDDSTIASSQNNAVIENNTKEDTNDNSETNETSQEKSEEIVPSSAKDDSKAYKLNHLADNEASFGTLEIPVYKKSEKNIKIPLLIYHGFFTPMLSSEDDPYKLMCSEELFEEQITTLLDAGYTFVTLEDIYKYDKGLIGLPEKNVCITMDDGWSGNYTDAFWLLKKYNIPATIFVVEELVGTTGYFDWDEAKEMYDSGLVKIHVHGQRHISATGYGKEGLQKAYNETHSKIEEVLGEKIKKIMAYPAGDCSDSTIKWLKEAGFEIQVQTKYGTVNKSKTLDLTALGRIRAEKASGKSILNTIENASAE